MRSVPQLLQIMWPAETESFERDLLTTKQSRLNEIAHKQRASGLTINTFVLEGPPFIEIIRLVNRNDDDMIVTDPSVDQTDEVARPENTNLRLLRKCPVPVWVLGSSPDSSPKTIAAAIDVQNTNPENLELNKRILNHAAEIGDRYSAVLHLVQAWELYGEGMLIRKDGLDAVDRAREQYRESIDQSVGELLAPFRKRGIEFECALLNGAPERAIPAFVQDRGIDLLVMGTVGRSGISGLIMGNTAETVLKNVTCSVLALKPEGFQSPVR
jgi:nucleotide-binding universal stress UspA family protein